ncbi:MAG: hypothetical protein NUV50_03755 [Rhodospirillales bacterium]|nr:hypothetical protein [Rhodospirillales bacterium]
MMRKVIYYSGGLVADFAISDKAFDKFLADLEDAAGQIERYGETDLMKARTLLDNFMFRARSDENADQGPGEILAACYIWNFFNTNPQADRVITGDIVIVDLDGSLNTVEYASVNDIQISHEHDHDHDHDHDHEHGSCCGHKH